MKLYWMLIWVCILVLASCAPRITTTISRSYQPLDYREEVIVLGLQDAVPAGAEELGRIKIGDTGFSTNCGWNVVIDKARLEARKVGGNAIKITEHIPPNVMVSTCDRISAIILKVNNFSPVPAKPAIDSALLNAGYALLHVYRRNGTGFLVNFDLHLGDSVICRVSNKWKTTLHISKDGLNSLWARTESKVEVPVNIKFGKEYYLRCGVTMGAFVGRPKLELVDNQTGKAEFESVK